LTSKNGRFGTHTPLLEADLAQNNILWPDLAGFTWIWLDLVGFLTRSFVGFSPTSAMRHSLQNFKEQTTRLLRQKPFPILPHLDGNSREDIHENSKNLTFPF
jgi:hypothetical protein